jgi:hypothetical protein
VDVNSESTPFVSEIVWEQENPVMGKVQGKEQADEYQCQNQNAFRGIALNYISLVTLNIICFISLIGIAFWCHYFSFELTNCNYLTLADFQFLLLY